MKKKIITSALAACLLVPAALTFSACEKDNPTFKVGQNITTSADAIVQYITTNTYNNLSTGRYSVADLRSQDSMFKYYVEVGMVDDFDDIDSITLGGTKMLDDETFSLSVGNGAYIVDECFFEDDDKLYVAAPIIAFEAVNNSTIKINNHSFDFNIATNVEKTHFENVTSQNENIIVEKIDDSNYNLDILNGKTYIKLDFDTTPTGPIVTKKVVGGKFNGYGISEAENPLLFYPVGYVDSFSQDVLNRFDNKEFVYEVYANSTIYSVTLNLDLITE